MDSESGGEESFAFYVLYGHFLQEITALNLENLGVLPIASGTGSASIAH